MTYYEAKFIRERKDRPTDWIIVPDGPYFRLCNVNRG